MTTHRRLQRTMRSPQRAARRLVRGKPKPHWSQREQGYREHLSPAEELLRIFRSGIGRRG